MHGFSRTPSGGGLVTGAARRGKESARGGFPREEYHGRNAGARPELFWVSTPQGRKPVGAFVFREGELVFEKRGDAQEHMLRWPTKAWAVAVEALEEAARRGVRRVVIHDRAHGMWWARLADFEEHGVPIDRGHGAQVALAVDWWSFAPRDSRTARQALLFAEVGA